MGYVTDKSADVYRDFNTAGVPASGPYDPAKPEIRGLFSFLDGALAQLLAGFVADQTVVVYAARSSLYANLAPADRTLGLVYNDGVNNGLYIKNGAASSGSWSATGLMLQGLKGDAATISIGTVTSGTAPAVTNTGPSSAAILNFVLQRGPDGKSFLQTAIDTGYVPAGTTEAQLNDKIVGQITAAAVAARDKAQEWAESQGEPGGSGTKSSKVWAAQSSTSASASATARDTALQTASTYTASLLSTTILYPDTASGLAGTAEGRYFAVASAGEVSATIYRRVSGAAVLSNTLASRAALDRIARFVPNGGSVDNAIAINAALNDALVSGVVLPAGDIETRSAIVVPTGKFLTGAGRGATRIVATANIAALANVGKGVVISNGTTGVRIGNFTVIAPKSTGVNGDKVQGVWMRNAKKWIVENVEAYNCGYAFWAHEFSEDGVFRNIASYNANVHFETTQAYRILFEGMVSGDGDGDNPLGFEAVWHCLLASRNITFRRGRHTGSGCAFLIIANNTNGDTQGGLIDDIRYEDCQAINTDGKLGMQIANFNNLPVGRVSLIDSGVEYASAAKAGVPAILSLGKVSMRGGRWKSFSQENFIIYAPASLDAVDVEVTVDANPAATGIVYNSEGPTRIVGGKITMTTASMTVGAGATLYVSPTTKIVTPNATYEPVGVGQRVSFVYPSDIAKASGYDGLLARFGTTAGRTYRVMLAGKQRKDGADGLLAFYIDAASGPIASTGFGRVEMQDAAGTYQPTSDTKLLAAVNGNIRAFNMDLTFVGNGNQVSINFGGGEGGATVLAGVRLSIERLA